MLSKNQSSTSEQRESKSLLNREFHFTQENFEQIVSLVGELTGISLTERKTDMVYSRLARRLRRLSLNDFASYLELVKNDEQERTEFINSLTTNLTHFFRESHHFDYLEKNYFPELFRNNKKKIRLWSAGCSTGEEPYSLAMIWQTLNARPNDIDFKILATDLDTNVLKKCREGIYSEEKLKAVADPYLKFFKQTAGCEASERKIHPKLKELIFFKQLNLMHDWPMSGPLDLIICRNVLIYFDKPTQRDLVSRFYQLLAPNGCLMLGHSENLSANRNMFNPLGKTIYRKVG